MSDKLFNEIFDAYNNKGSSIKKRRHSQNGRVKQSFAHYRW